MPRTVDREEPCFPIGTAARLVGLHTQTLRYYERAGLVQPSRSKGRIRLYSQRDIARLEQIHRLTDDLGLNLAGVEVALRMLERMAELEGRLRTLTARLYGLEHPVAARRRR